MPSRIPYPSAMKIIDISQEVFTCAVYPGDKSPVKTEEMRIVQGASCNVTSFSMCAHNGTHIDAPFHFIEDGETIDQLPLEKLIGDCYVSEQNADIGRKQALMMISSAAIAGTACHKKLLIKGTGRITLEAAEIFAEMGVDLIGVEGQSVAPADAPMPVHKVLLGAKVVLLEGLRLTNVRQGRYMLYAAPLALGGSDGAPCRAVLVKK